MIQWHLTIFCICLLILYRILLQILQTFLLQICSHEYNFKLLCSQVTILHRPLDCEIKSGKGRHYFFSFLDLVFTVILLQQDGLSFSFCGILPQKIFLFPLMHTISSTFKETSFHELKFFNISLEISNTTSTSAFYWFFITITIDTYLHDLKFVSK